jgi:hypothetical protein
VRAEIGSQRPQTSFSVDISSTITAKHIYKVRKVGDNVAVLAAAVPGVVTLRVRVEKGYAMKLSIVRVLGLLSVVGVCGSIAQAAGAEATISQPREVRPAPRPAMFVYSRPLGTSSLHGLHRLRDPDVGATGRPWISQPIMNEAGVHGPRLEDRTCEEPGAFRYGAPGDDLRTAYVRVNTLTIGISPWQRIEPRGLKHLENARNRWLADRGYTGGVRTIRNDALHMQTHREHDRFDAAHASLMNDEVHTHDGAVIRPEAVEPRATFKIAPDVTRFRKRMQVQTPWRPTNFVLGSQDCSMATVGPSVATVRGEQKASVTLVLPRGTSAASIVRANAARAQADQSLAFNQASGGQQSLGDKATATTSQQTQASQPAPNDHATKQVAVETPVAKQST